ncbi:MAG TPA: serine dehydratase beta chain, partial [Polyangiaceae bacterium]
MSLSVFDLFTIGIGPSSSHTVGPMRAARRFVLALEREGRLDDAAQVKVELYGSLGATGKGHGSDGAVMLGLEGAEPETVEPDAVRPRVEAITSGASLSLLGKKPVAFSPAEHIVFHRLQQLPKHPNGMRFSAFDAGGAEIAQRTYYSVGGGFVVGEATSADAPAMPTHETRVPHPFTTGAELLSLCATRGLCIGTLMMENERALAGGDDAHVRTKLLAIWTAMRACVARGCEREGILPGGLKVKRRAPALHRKLVSDARRDDPLIAL